MPLGHQRVHQSTKVYRVLDCLLVDVAFEESELSPQSFAIVSDLATMSQSDILSSKGVVLVEW